MGRQSPEMIGHIASCPSDHLDIISRTARLTCLMHSGLFKPAMPGCASLHNAADCILMTMATMGCTDVKILQYVSRPQQPLSCSLPSAEASANAQASASPYLLEIRKHQLHLCVLHCNSLKQHRPAEVYDDLLLHEQQDLVAMMSQVLTSSSDLLHLVPPPQSSSRVLHGPCQKANPLH